MPRARKRRASGARGAWSANRCTRQSPRFAPCPVAG